MSLNGRHFGANWCPEKITTLIKRLFIKQCQIVEIWTASKVAFLTRIYIIRIVCTYILSVRNQTLFNFFSAPIPQPKLQSNLSASLMWTHGYLVAAFSGLCWSHSTYTHSEDRQYVSILARNLLGLNYSRAMLSRRKRDINIWGVNIHTVESGNIRALVKPFNQHPESTCSSCLNPPPIALVLKIVHNLISSLHIRL